MDDADYKSERARREVADEPLIPDRFEAEKDASTDRKKFNDDPWSFTPKDAKPPF